MEEIWEELDASGAAAGNLEDFEDEERVLLREIIWTVFMHHLMQVLLSISFLGEAAMLLNNLYVKQTQILPV